MDILGLCKNVTNHILSYLDTYSHFYYSITCKYNKKYYPAEQIKQLLLKKQYIMNQTDHNDKKITSLAQYIDKQIYYFDLNVYGDEYYCLICETYDYHSLAQMVGTRVECKIPVFDRVTKMPEMTDTVIDYTIKCSNCYKKCISCHKSEIKKIHNCYLCDHGICTECEDSIKPLRFYDCVDCGAFDAIICGKCEVISYCCKLCKIKKCLLCLSSYDGVCLSCRNMDIFDL